MFSRLKERAKITEKDAKFKVRYIGYLETFLGSGKGCTTAVVQTLWDNAEEEEFLPRVKVKVTTFGLHIKHLDGKKQPDKVFHIENISFSNVDIPVNDRIFSWIYRETDDKQFKCHAVICTSTEKARAMSLVLSRAFQIAFKEWKMMQTRSLREKGKSQRSVSMYTSSETKKHELLSRHRSEVMVSTRTANRNSHKLSDGLMSVDKTNLADNHIKKNGDSRQTAETESVVEKL